MTRASSKTSLNSFMERESALELARRSMLGAPVYSLISLIMLVGTPAYSNYGLWSLLEAAALLLMGVVRVVLHGVLKVAMTELGNAPYSSSTS